VSKVTGLAGAMHAGLKSQMKAPVKAAAPTSAAATWMKVLEVGLMTRAVLDAVCEVSSIARLDSSWTHGQCGTRFSLYGLQHCSRFD
jgi:hypothetical protein